MLRFLSVLLVSVSLVASSSSVAHEFWIEPQMARVPENGTIVADLRVGQDFSGTSFPYLSHRFVRFWFRDGGADHPVAGNEGDIPAIRIDRAAPGRHNDQGPARRPPHHRNPRRRRVWPAVAGVAGLKWIRYTDGGDIWRLCSAPREHVELVNSQARALGSRRYTAPAESGQLVGSGQSRSDVAARAGPHAANTTLH